MSNILLESGTNELELLEFKVGNEYYGINVMKVREVLNLQPSTRLPESHPVIDGILKIRDDIITQINLVKFLGQENTDNDKVIITEFNIQKLAFRVSEVSKIERISWTEIDTITNLQAEVPIVGVVKFQDRLVLILDLENIVASIFPNPDQIDFDSIEKLADARIAIADDSNFILQMINSFLAEGGYKNIQSFHNGQEALDYIESNPDSIDVLITDIEMPQMDGLTLCKKVKDNLKTKHITVMLYSSLVTDDIRHKGNLVGADFQVNKPQFEDILKELGKMKNEH